MSGSRPRSWTDWIGRPAAEYAYPAGAAAWYVLIPLAKRVHVTGARAMEINGKEIAVEQQGDGDAVVMVHGLGGTANSWHPQVGPLARFFRVVRLDLEGSGRSPATGALSIASFAADVIAVMDELDISTAHLCGHSMGTIVCQHIAAEWPERVKSLVLLGPLAEPPEPARQAIRDRAGVARKSGMVPIADTLVEVAISAETRAHHPSSAAFVREILMRQDAEGYARTCEALAAAETADLTNIGCQTLLITGDEDGVSPPPAVKALGKRIKGSRLAVLPGCGHWTPIERPTQVNGLLLNFYYSFN